MEEPQKGPTPPPLEMAALLSGVGAKGKSMAKAVIFRVRSTAKVWVFELGVSIAIVAASIFRFLTNPGYYAYADQFWSIAPGLPNTESFTLLIVTSGRLTPVSFFQFTRDFVTFPYVPLSYLGISYESEIRIFMFGTFLVLIGLMWITAAVVLRMLESASSTKLNGIQGEFVKLFFVLALYCNFVLIQVTADGGQVSDSLIFVGSVLAVCLVVKNSPRAHWLVGAVLSLGLLLDPDYYILVLIILITVALVTGIQSRNLFLRMGVIFKALVLSLPSLFFVLAGLLLTTTPGGLGATYRPVSDAIYFSRNMTPLSAMLSEGFAWPFVTLGPPSILTVPGPLYSLPSWGSPAVLLLPSGVVTSLWMASTFALPILCFSSLLARGFRRVALPVVTAGLVGIGLAQFARTPLLFGLISSLSDIPLIGFAIGTTFAVPDHILAMVSIAEVIGATITVYAMLSRKCSWPWPPANAQANSLRLIRKWVRLTVPSRARQRFLSGKVGTALAISAVILVVFSGWQALNGSYFPARPLNSEFIGNGVPAVGAFAPFDPPNYTVQAYQYVFRSGSAFNVFWPVGYGVGLSSYTSGPSLVSLPGLPYLLSHNLVADVSPYLAAHGVRYVVVENITKPIPQFYLPSPSAANNLYSYYFGLENFTKTIETLKQCPGLNESFSRPGIDVFEVSTFRGLGYPSSVLLHSASEAGENASLYGAFAESGLNVSLTDSTGWGRSASIGESTDSIRILTPFNLSAPYLQYSSLPTRALNTTINMLGSGVVYFANSTEIQSSATWSQNQSRGQFNYAIDGFYFTNWEGNYTVTVTSGGISVFSRGGATFTLNYGGPAMTTTDGITIASGIGPLVTGLDATLSVSDPPFDTIAYAFSAVGPGKQTLWNQISYAPNSTASTSVSMSQLLPVGFSSFAYRLGGTFRQYLNISAYNVSVAQDPVVIDRDAPFGGAINLRTAEIPVPGSGEVGIAIARGNGSVNGVVVDSQSPLRYTIPVRGRLSVRGTVALSSLILFEGDNLSTYLDHYVVYNGAFSDAVIVEYSDSSLISPISTVYGTNLYVLPGGGPYRFAVSSSITALEIVYPLVLAYVTLLILIGLTRVWRPGAIFRQKRRRGYTVN